jgi:acyl-homoserine lactone acylase PvdQ
MRQKSDRKGFTRPAVWGEFHDSLRDWVAPLQNIVHADIEGNIAYSHPGHIPIRARGDGTIPVPGWSGEYEWTGYIPFEELPHVINPDRGYIVTGNNRIVDDDYPHFLTVETMVGPPFRFIADLSDLRNSWGLLTPGNSGHPASKHYDDQVQAWFNAGNPVPAGYHPMLYDRADVDRHAQARLYLTPG